MSKPDDKNAKTHPVVGWARLGAAVLEDISRGILGFIPNGLSLTYDGVLKPFPIVGKLFSHLWVEKALKLVTGITILQSLSMDVGRCLFWPLGFAGGLLIGSTMRDQPAPSYQKQASKFLYELSGQTVGGALAGVLILFLGCQFLPHVFTAPFDLSNIIKAAGCGAVIGIVAKGMLLLAMNMVNGANSNAIIKNGERAKALNAKLIKLAKLRAKSRVLSQAQDIIQQMNGPQSQPYLEAFFNSEYDNIATSLYEKIERHFNYLADRACCGDMDALKRMQALVPSDQASESTPLDKVLDRMLNGRTLAKLKDDMDTYYDRWYYQFLTVKNA